MINFIKNILIKKNVKADKIAPSVSGGQVSRPELERLVKEGTHRALREYGKTFEILKEYDKT